MGIHTFASKHFSQDYHMITIFSIFLSCVIGCIINLLIILCVSIIVFLNVIKVPLAQGWLL